MSNPIIPDCPQDPTHHVAMYAKRSEYVCQECGEPLPDEVQPTDKGDERGIFIERDDDDRKRFDTGRLTEEGLQSIIETSVVDDDVAEERLDALEGADSLREAAETLDMPLSSLADWSRRNYPDHGRFKSGGSVSDEEYLRRVRVLEEVEYLTVAADVLDLSVSGMRSWARRNYDRYTEEFSPKAVAERD